MGPWDSGWSRTCREAGCRARAWLGVLRGGKDRGGNGQNRPLPEVMGPVSPASAAWA